MKAGYNQENNQLVVHVEDSGKGIDPAKKDGLFAQYSKLGSNREGAGLGLSICKEIIIKSGGDIKAYSEG